MKSENPAQRLYDAISDFNTVRHKHPNVGALAIWQVVWSVGDGEIFARILDLSALIADVEKCIKFDPQVSNKTRYLSWVQPFKQTLHPNMLMQGHGAVASTYNAEGIYMHALEFCCEALSKSCAENSIPQEKVSELQSQLNSLFSEVSNEVSDAKTRAFLLDLLASVEFGLRTFQIRGPLGIEEALDLALGKLLRHKAEFDFQQKNESSGIFKKFLSFLKTTGEVVDSSKKIADGLTLAASTYDQVISTLPS